LLTSKNLSFRAICTNGLKDYNSIDNIDECVISGMGGFEIIKIISNSPININTYILSPQHNIIDVKKFMIENNYFITYDKVIKDENKFYNIIKCEKTNVVKKINEFDLYFGKNNFEGSLSDFEDYLIYLKNKNIKLKNCVSEECKKEIEKILTYIQIAEERIGKNNE
jgi:tRNA A22 N-methylase